MYEVRAAMKYGYYANKDGWEQARFIAYITAQCNSTKKLSLSDIMQFYWEEQQKDSTAMSNADLERLKEKAKQYINNKNNG